VLEILFERSLVYQAKDVTLETTTIGKKLN